MTMIYGCKIQVQVWWLWQNTINPAPDFISRCKQNKQAGLVLVYSDQDCWYVESPIIVSVTQALNYDMGDGAVTFSRVERASESDDELYNL